MIKKNKLFKKSLLLKASFYNGIIISVKIFNGFLLSKITAFFLGPSGLALLGNLSNLIQTALGFTAEGYQNGTIRYISELGEQQSEERKIIATLYQLSVLISSVIAVFFIAFAKYISFYLFNTFDYASVIQCIALGLPFLSINLITLYILNGKENYFRLVQLNVVLSIVSVVATYMSAKYFSLYGVLISMGIIPVFVFIINYISLGKDRYLLKFFFKFKYFSFDILSKMSAYFIMAVYSIVIISVTMILIRNLIIEHLGLKEAGYWEAMNKISSFYVMFFISLTSFYLLPQFSKTNEFKGFKRKIIGFYKLSIPLALLFFSLIYFFRNLILEIVLSKEFLPTSKLFFYRILGDIVSILAIALVKQFHAKLMMKAYMICNGLLNMMYLVISYLFIDIFGLEGVMKAYAISYFLYFVVVILFLYNHFKKPTIQ